MIFVIITFNLFF